MVAHGIDWFLHKNTLIISENLVTKKTNSPQAQAAAAASAASAAATAKAAQTAQDVKVRASGETRKRRVSR